MNKMKKELKNYPQQQTLFLTMNPPFVNAIRPNLIREDDFECDFPVKKVVNVEHRHRKCRHALISRNLTSGHANFERHGPGRFGRCDTRRVAASRHGLRRLEWCEVGGATLGLQRGLWTS